MFEQAHELLGVRVCAYVCIHRATVFSSAPLHSLSAHPLPCLDSHDQLPSCAFHRQLPITSSALHPILPSRPLLLHLQALGMKPKVKKLPVQPKLDLREMAQLTQAGEGEEESNLVAEDRMKGIGYQPCAPYLFAIASGLI